MGLVGLVATVVVLYSIAMQFPQLSDKARVEASFAAAHSRNQSLEEQATKPEVNGYLSPTFLPYWGRKGMEYEPDSETERVVEQWKKFSSQAMEKKIDHIDLLTRKDPSYLEARGQFEALVPELLEALEKPVYFPPNSPLLSQTLLPNMNANRSCAQALCALAESKVAQGKSDEAVEMIARTILAGERLSGSGFLLVEMFGVVMQAIGADAFLGLIDPEKLELTPELWQSLTEELVESVPSKDILVQSFEAEMTSWHDTFQKGIDNEFFKINKLTDLPGYLQREQRIYLNAMCDMQKQAESQSSLVLPSYLTRPGLWDWISGRTGHVAQMLIPNYDRAGGQLAVNRARTAGLATILGVLNYRAKQGGLPETLDDLASVGIPMVEDPDFKKSLTYQKEGDRATLKIVLQTSPTIDWSLSNYWSHPWCEADREAILYSFGPRS